MHLKVRQVGTALAAAAALVAVPAAGAHADTTSQLRNLTSFNTMIVDNADGGHVFISQGLPGAGIVVTDLSGNYQITLDTGDNVNGLALSSDGATLYAAVAGGTDKGEVAKISVSSITSTPSQTFYPLGAGEIPSSLAMQSGKLWVSYNDGTAAGGGAIGDIDISAASPAFVPDALPEPSGNWYLAPLLAGDPGDSGVLVAAVRVGGQPVVSTQAASYHVAGASPTLSAQASPLVACDYLNDLAVLPGGTEFTAACYGANPTYSTAGSLGLEGTPPAAASYVEAAVAITVNGAIAEGSSSDYGSVVTVYSQGVTDALATYSSAGGTLPARGLAWSPDGSRLYAVVQLPESVYVLYVYHPALAQSSLSLSAPGNLVIGKPYTVTGDLTLSTGTPPAGTLVRVTRTKPGTTTMYWTCETSAYGTFTISDQPPALGTYTYTATFAGNFVSAPATVTRQLQVIKRTVSLKITTSAGNVPYSTKVRITAHLGHTYKMRNRVVAIYDATIEGTKRVLLKRGEVNSHGNLTVWYRAPHSKVFSASYTGDQYYGARTVTRTVGVWVNISTKNTGYYQIMRDSNPWIHLYRRSAKLKSAIHITPDKQGQCVRLQVQAAYNGSWHASMTTGCVALNKYSEATLYLSLKHAVKFRLYRVRARYTRSVHDRGNLSTAGPWFYYTVQN